MLECIHIYKNLVIYYQNINMDTDPDLQLLIQLKLFILLFQTTVIMVFILDQYSIDLFIDTTTTTIFIDTTTTTTIKNTKPQSANISCGVPQA